ncbi:autotransporter domain-containing protein [Vibrio mediterranei]|uniref:autotransporter domain-containing protein n=1 Tax=Vibrio mediterranei TaxID=689 RepID=UPI0017F18FE7|nr:autotransporter domain-containing protein [Vibrio mediterranei]NUW74575.1 autotransporter domain-containing protein [Vibrio mediterranei]
MKKLLASALIVASSSTIAAGMDDVNFNILAGYDRNAPTVAFEVDYSNILLGTQLHAEKTQFVTEAPSDSQYSAGKTEQNKFSIYAGYRFNNGLTLKAGTTISKLEFSGFGGNAKDVEAKIDAKSSKVLAFVGAGYEFENGFNMNLHSTIGNNDKVELGKYGHAKVEDKANISFLVGYRF